MTTRYKPGPRSEEFHQRWLAGETLDEIGISVGLSRERVRQLIYALRESEDGRERKRSKAAVTSWVAENPLRGYAECAQALGISPENVRYCVDAPLLRVELKRKSTTSITREDCLKAIRRVGVGSAVEYRNRKASTYPSPELVELLFGSWAEAVREAGLVPAPPDRTNYVRTVPRGAEARAALVLIAAEWMTTMPKTLAWTELVRWSGEEGKQSVHTLRAYAKTAPQGNKWLDIVYEAREIATAALKAKS